MAELRPSKHKPNEKHTLDEVLKSLKDLVHGEVLDKPRPVTAPVPMRKTASAPPSADMRDIINSLEALLSEGLSERDKPKQTTPPPAPPAPVAAAPIVAAPQPPEPPPPAFSTDEIAAGVLQAFDDIELDDASSSLATSAMPELSSIDAAPEPDAGTYEEITMEAPSFDEPTIEAVVSDRPPALELTPPVAHGEAGTQQELLLPFDDAPSTHTTTEEITMDAAPAPQDPVPEEIGAGPEPDTSQSDNDNGEDYSVEFLQNVQDMIDQGVEEISLEAAPPPADDSAETSTADDEEIELVAPEATAHEIEFDAAPAPENETAPSDDVDFDVDSPAAGSDTDSGALPPESEGGMASLEAESLGAPAMDLSGGSDSESMIVDLSEPPSMSSGAGVDAPAGGLGENVELEIDLSAAEPITTTELAAAEPDQTASAAEKPANKPKLELSLAADGWLTDSPTPPPATGTVEAPAPAETHAPAAAPKKAKPARAEKPQPENIIPTLEDVAVPPPQAALPIPPSPDSVRETAVRVIAKLNIELRKAGDKPLSAKTVMRLQQLLHEAIAKKNADKKM